MFRTDLAIEMGEKYRENNVEIEGVVIEERCIEETRVTVVDIVNEMGSKAYERPVGRYVTIEYDGDIDSKCNRIVQVLSEYIEKMIRDISEKKILVVGLGNKDITPDALGPLVIEQVNVTRHVIRAFGYDNILDISAIAPGVMGQTGMEVYEIIEALVKELDINIVIAIDALAARSTSRLNKTIQVTNTGICPGAGVGNNRKELSKKKLGVDVIAVGVPTVVDANTIVNDVLEKYMMKKGFTIDEIEGFSNEVKKENVENMIVTSKDIDENIKSISRIIGQSINELV